MELSLYRKYRPQTFDQVVGQDHVSRTLRNAISSDSVAHAYVFAGPRGIGKTSMAKILAKGLNCEGPDAAGEPVTRPTVEPCGSCESCLTIAASTALDVIEMDAASNRGIDDIRELRDKVAFAPARGRRKVYIIDEAHMLTKEAFNALLKTLEEPPPHVVFVLATTEVHKLPETILSRCQRFDFRRPLVQEIAGVLGSIAATEGIEVDDHALLEIARHAEGGFRDAIGTLEKLATYFAPGGDAAQRITSQQVMDVLGIIPAELLFEVGDIVVDGDAAGALLFVQRLAERGTNYSQFIRDLLRHLRQLFVLQHLGELSTGDTRDAAVLRALEYNLELDEHLLDRLLTQAHQLAAGDLLRFIERLGQAQTEIRAGLDPRLQLELALVKVCKPHLDHTPEALEERLRRLESGSVPLPSREPPQPARSRPTPAPRSAAAAASSSPAAGASSPPVATPEDPDAPLADAAADSDAAGARAVESAPADAVVDVATEPDSGAAGQAAGVPAASASKGADAADDSANVAVADGSPDIDAAAGTADTAAVPAAGGEPSAEPSAERAQRAWGLILEALNTQSAPLYAVLKESRLRAADERLVIELPSHLARDKAAEPDNAALLAAVVRKACGCQPTISFELAPETGAPLAQIDAEAEASQRDESLDTAQAIAFLQQELGAVELPDDE